MVVVEVAVVIVVAAVIAVAARHLAEDVGEVGVGERHQAGVRRRLNRVLGQRGAVAHQTALAEEIVAEPRRSHAPLRRGASQGGNSWRQGDVARLTRQSGGRRRRARRPR